MKTRNTINRLSATAMLLLAAGTTGVASADDCRLSVSPQNPVLLPGETTAVHVWAHFPASGFAFASSDFVVRAGMPGWGLVSAGVVAGADVLGISASQQHMPHMGIVAEPNNPRRIWTGVFTPASYDPALVRVRATPTAFEYYPSELTSSSVPCDADPGRAWIMINPLQAGRMRGAPGAGTSASPAGNGAIVGEVAGPQPAILIGLLLPAVQKVREAAGRMENDSLRIDIGLPPASASDTIPTDQMSLNFSKIEFQYNVQVEWAGSIMSPCIVLATGQTICFEESESGVLPFPLPRYPDTRRVWIEHNEPNDETTIFIELGFDEPIEVEVPGLAPQPTRTVRMECTNNLKQIGIGLHTYHAQNVQWLRVALEGECQADYNGDGQVNSNDISAFLSSWLASVQNGTLGADFNLDGQVNSNDISAFLSAWLDAVQNGC